MKRFWRVAEAVEADGGFAIALDGRRVRTPARADLIVAAPALAAAVAAEWSAAGETVDPRAMPLTGLANAALDHVAADRARFAAGLARYGEADLLYYRAEGPPALVTMQATAWDPLLDWARTRFGIRFVIGGGIRHLAQPQATIDALAGAVAGLDPFRLAGLSPLVTIGGSLRWRSSKARSRWTRLGRR